MAMKKAEMEEHWREYQEVIDRARQAERDGLYRQAVELALESWGYIDGMMQYARRYEDKEFTTVSGINMILKYAPLLLDYPSLDRLEALLKDCRRIVKNTSVNLAERLTEARDLMWHIHRLWDHLEWHPEAKQDELREALGGDQEQWRSVTETWERMGLLRRAQDGRSYRLALTTQLAKVTRAKCPTCGHIGEAPKAMFLAEMTCPECNATGLFVILSSHLIDSKKE